MPTTKMSAAQKHAGREKILDAAKDWLKKEALSSKNYRILSNVFVHVANAIEDGNWDKARIILREFWFRASKESIYKRLYSEGEVVKMLNEYGEGSWYRDMALKTNEVLKGIGELLDVVKIVTAIFNKDTWKLLVSINEEVKKDPYKRGAREDSETLRRRAREGADKFIQLSDVVQNLTRLIPLPVIGVYINYSFAMLKGAEALFNTVEKYADRIVAEVKEVDKAISQNQSKNSLYNLNRYVESERGMDYFLYNDNRKRR